MQNTSRVLSAAAGALLFLMTAGAGAQQAEHGHGGHVRSAPYSAHYDTQYNHNHYYTTRGVAVAAVPGRPYVVAHGDGHYY